MTRRIIIEDDVFEVVPNFERLAFLCTIDPSLVPPSDLSARLKMAVKNASQIELSVPSITKWEQAHRGFGSNPNKFPPSLKALVKRARNKGTLPYINAYVAVMNTMSLELLTPCGGDDLKATKGNLTLKRAIGNECFYPLSNPSEKQTPNPGEIIYVDDNNEVLCRRLNWQNSFATRLTKDTSELLINLDFLEASPSDVEQKRTLMTTALENYFGTSVSSFHLHANNNFCTLSAT